MCRTSNAIGKVARPNGNKRALPETTVRVVALATIADPTHSEPTTTERVTVRRTEEALQRAASRESIVVELELLRATSAEANPVAEPTRGSWGVGSLIGGKQ